MNTKIIHRATFLVTSIVLSIAGHAFTLGDLRGSAILGQPLDVSASINVGDGETISEDCLSAQLLFGDIPQPPAKLHLQKSTTSAASVSVVRIASTVVVNEPVVTVVLRATCGSTTSRRYVLLSEFPAADLPTVDALPIAKSTGATSPSQKTNPMAAADAPLPLAASPAVTPKTSIPARASKPKRAKPDVATGSKKKDSSALRLVNQAPAHQTNGKEPDGGHLSLKLDSEMIILNPEELAAAAARRVSLPTLEPEGEVLKQSLELESLRNDLKTFKEIVAKNQATLAGLEIKLRQAEDERIPVIWFYLLGGLLLVALAALVWVLRQQQAAKKAWWHQADEYMTETIGPVASVAPSAPATMVHPSNTPAVQDAPLVDLDFDLDNLSATTVTDTQSQDVAVPSSFGSAHDLSSELISDIRQQAEFFVSLGQASRAIDLLHRQIQESTEPHPLVYLDLLTLYHSQGMKTEFRELRVHFNRLFHCVAPDFPVFHQEGKVLLAYPELLAELVRTWPSGEAAAFLEACVFRNDSSALGVDFDLAAFRDLLLLRTLVKKAKTSSPSVRGMPLESKEHQNYPANLPDTDVTPSESSPAADQATMPDTMSASPSSWFTPPPVPTTEELDLEFPIDMLKTTKTPDH